VSTKEGGVLEDWMLDWLAVKSNDYGMSTSHERSDKTRMVGGEAAQRAFNSLGLGLGYCVVKQY
jgi:hypothetical protein